MMRKILSFLLLLLPVASEAQETVDLKILKPLKWFGENWSGYDPAYSIPSFYNWAFHLQNTSSVEWLRNETPDGMDVEMTSRLSHKVGPYLGWNFLFYGATVDLNALGKPTKRRNEFTLSVNSNLVNLDLIRRRTGGDFKITKLTFADPTTKQTVNLKDVAEMYELGDYIKYDLTGFNLNIFTNHRKYSNPAAFSNGAIQLRSAGSPIVGFGYTRQKVTSEMADLFTTIASDFAFDESGLPIISYDELYDMEELYDTDRQAYLSKLNDILDEAWPQLVNIGGSNKYARLFVTNRIPTVTKIDDWHLQLGYAYNLVFSRRLLLGLSLVVSPGIKRIRANNEESLTYQMADNFDQLILKHQGYRVPGGPDYFRYYFDDSGINLNTFARASLTYNHNRWRAGFLATYSNYYYNKSGMDIDNAFGNLTLYVGYCFGRKKEYRYDGEQRQEYINAALTKSHIEEMKDTMPASNLLEENAYSYVSGEAPEIGKTDKFTIRLKGCELARGLDGYYGVFRVDDGFVTPGGDRYQRMYRGMLFTLDPDGSFFFEGGHKLSFRAGNWWKKAVRRDEIAHHWYPEMLHYAYKGRLVLYLQGDIFGTDEPVKLELDGVCFAHGTETSYFMLMGVEGFAHVGSNRIQGLVDIAGKSYRLIIRQAKFSTKATLSIEPAV